jgi:hypothetical protein
MILPMIFGWSGYTYFGVLLLAVASGAVAGYLEL